MDYRLQELHESFDSASWKSAENIIGNLTTLLSKEIESIEPLIVSIFDETYGILAFIRKSVSSRKKSFETPTAKAIEIIHTLVLNLPKELGEHMLAISDACMAVVKINTSSKLTQNALLVLELIVEDEDFRQNVNYEDEIRDIFDTIYRLLKYKSTNTVTERYLDLIGSIAQYYPQLIEDEFELQTYLIKLLTFSLREREPPTPTITGIFSCFKKFLISFPLDQSGKLILYEALKRYSQFDEVSHKKVVYRTALNLFERHMSKFFEEVFEERDLWASRFRRWLDSSNAEDLKAGYGALYAFYKEMGFVLQIPCEENQNSLRKLLKSFRADVMDKSKMKLSVKVLGYLCAALKVNLPANLSSLFLLLLNRVEFTFLRDIDSSAEFLDILPDFIQTLSIYCKNLDDLSPYHAGSLQKVSVLMIRLFPKVSNAHHGMVINSLINTFSCINHCRGYTLKAFLREVVYQGILWTCSHNIIEEVGSSETTYQTFLPLWKGLLTDENLQKALFKELIKVLLIQIMKLKLEVERVDETSTSMDPALIYKAVHPPDQIIFVNLVNLYVELLDSSPPKLFKECFPFYTKHVLKHSEKHPLISGFYKLLAVALKISDKVNYFSTRSELSATYENVIKRIIPKIKRHKGDLQLSLIQVVLAAPTLLINDINEDYTPIFVTVFAVGRTNLEFAELGVEILQKWLRDMPQHKSKLMKLLPMLDTFLCTQATVGAATPSLETRKTLKSLHKRKVVLDIESPLIRLQRKILCFVGEMSSEMCYEFVKCGLGQMIWEEKAILKVELPYADHRIKLYLDKFVPRTLELAVYCSNRKIKFTACELFHSLVMIFLGEKTTSKKLCEKIAHGVLVLGCDEDFDVQKLFSPLCLQLMHYYSSKGLFTSIETDIILETLFEGISNANDVKLRDFCGQCLKEFVLWTNKQHSKSNNLDKIIDTLKYFSLHPDPSKRLGAALIFNNIYVELRENEDYLNLYWLDLLLTFINSAEMLHEEDYVDQVYLCLNRLMRVLMEKSDFFEMKMSNRKIPTELKTGSLEDVGEFLLKKTSSINAYCRRKSMELFIKLDMAMAIVLNNSEMFFGEYEHYLKTKDKIQDCNSKTEICKWLESIKCLLEGFTFVLDNKLLRVIDYESTKISNKLDNLMKYVLSSATPHELKSKSDFVFESLMKFYSAILQHSNPENIISKTFYRFISTHIFKFNSIEPTFIDIFIIKTTETQKKEFITAVRDVILDIKNPPFGSSKINFASKPQKDLIQGLLTLQTTKLAEEIDLCEFHRGDVQKHLTTQSKFNDNLEYCELLLKLSGSKEFAEIFAIISNPENYVHPDTGESLCFGYHVFKTFRNILTEIIFKYFKDYLSIAFGTAMPIINVYYIIIDTLSGDNKEHFEGVVEGLNKQWKRFQTLFDEDFGLAVELIGKLNRIGKIRSEVLFDWAVDRIGDVNRFWDEEKNSFVNHLVQIFGFVAPVGKQDKFRESLDILWQQCKETYELDVVGTTLTISKLFEAARISNSVEILRFALRVYATTKHNVETREVYTLSLNNDNKTPSSSKTEIIKEIFCMTQNTNFDQTSRILVTKYLSYLIQTATHQIFEEFFTEHIAEFLGSFQHTASTKEDYTKRITYFILIETLCFGIDQNKFITKTCPITKAAIPGPLKTGTELLRALIKISRDISKETPPNDGNLKESFRLYQCFAYNALIYVICNTQNTMDYYKMLFKNNENNLWSKIIDVNVAYAFQLDVDQQPKVLQKFLNIRSEKPVELTGKYLESQHLFNSTLNEDICRYDFSNITVRSKGLGSRMSVQFYEEDLNKHECMEAMCGLIKHMAAKNLMPANKVPAWVHDLKQLLLDGATHRNIKYFFGQVFVNNAEELRVYRSTLIAPILKLASSLDSINSFFHDLMYLIDVWSDVEITDEDKEHASELIKFLMENAYDETRTKFKKNLQFLKVLVEKWKDCFVVPYDVVLQKLNCVSTSKELELGIQIINILLINNIPPWKNTMKDLTTALKNTLSSSHRNIYTFGAETVGLTLNFVEKHEQFKKNFERIYKIILDHLKISVPKDSVFDCLEGIGKYFPQICDEYMAILLSKDFLSIQGALKCTYLKICYGRVEKFQELNGFSKIEIKELLSDYNEDVQIITLEVISKSMEYLCTNERGLIRIIIKELKSLSKHKSTTCRNIIYEILIFFYKRFSESNEEEDLVNLCKEILLNGLKENEDELQIQIFNFWRENPAVPKDLNHRLTYLLSNMFYTSNQEIFLAYNSKILLDIFMSSRGYEENIYTNALIPNTQYEDCEFTTNWGSQTMCPIFASQKSGFIKATQEPVFQPTLASKRSGYMLTQPDQGSIAGSFVNPNLVKISGRYKLGERFLKNKREVSKGHAYREIRKKEKKKVIRKDLSVRSEKEIKVYRSYRSGDFPDIQIKLSAVLKPLEVLAKDDINICKLLYCSLFDAAYEISKQNRETNVFFTEISTAVNNIFSSNTEFDTGLINCLLDIAIKYKKYFSFNPGVIASVSLNSGLMSLGCLLLEEYLIEETYSSDPPKTKKIKGTTNDLETLHWIKLAELYKSLEDWDMVHGIFAKMRYDQSGLLEEIRNAFSAENQCSWKEAKDTYRRILEIDDNEDRQDFYYISYFNCLAELSEWDEVSKRVEEIVPVQNIWEDLWSSSWNKDKLLPYYITSQMRSSLTDFNVKNEFVKCLKDLQMNDPERKEYLLCNHAEELAFLGIIDGEVNLSKNYLETFIRDFLIEWNHTNPLFTALRAKKIMAVRSCMDIYHFVTSCYSRLNSNVLKDIGKYWESTSVENFGSIIQMDKRNLYRKQFAAILRKKLPKNQEFEDVVYKMDVALIECALTQGNHYVAEKYFQQLTAQQSKHNLLHSKILFLQDKSNSESILQSLEYLDRHLKSIDFVKDPAEYLSAMLYQNEVLTAASNLAIPNSAITTSLPVSMALLSRPSQSIEDLTVGLLSRCTEACEDSANSPVKLMSEAFHKLANYAKNSKNIGSLLSFAFKAIKYESIEARLLFPYLLEVITKENLQQFVHESMNIPNWMFIQWIPQMLAEINTEKSEAVSKILLSIAEDYPFAVQYPFRMLKRQQQDVAFNVFDQLESLLRNQEIDDLLEALGSVFLPLHVLENAVKHLAREFDAKSTESFQQHVSEVLETFYGKQYHYSNNYSARGQIFDSVRKYERKIRDLKQDVGDTQKILEKLRKLCDDLREEKLRSESKRSDNLGSYSPRLKNYRGSDIEIPGQYKGNGKPLPQYHVKISGFSSKVKIMTSLRKPIAISMLGSDTKEYNFLIKCGEDLRQDQRIQQLFNLMNDSIHGDPACFKRNLKIVTYEVIPLTSNLGIIELVNDVKPLNGFFDSQRGKVTKIITNFCAELRSFAGSHSGGGSDVELYRNAALKMDRKRACDLFQSYVQSFAWDTLRKPFHGMSVDLENLFVLRNNFIRSYSVMCVSNWLLGIGDRHLDNILISMKTGEAIGIDFGHAFGSGVQCLDIPELVPFRLTPQIVNVMKPQGIEGTFRETMIHTLRALRKRSDALLATMHIFIKEPTLGRFDVAEDKIEFARRKIIGDHSRNIMADELKCRKNETAFEHYSQHVKGRCGIVEEMEVDGEMCGLSVEKQVEGLLEHAMDENLLIRMYYGWKPWL